jgi:hypothetical protein
MWATITTRASVWIVTGVVESHASRDLPDQFFIDESMRPTAAFQRPVAVLVEVPYPWPAVAVGILADPDDESLGEH